MMHLYINSSYNEIEEGVAGYYLLLPSYYCETLRYHHVPPVDPFIGKQEQQQTQSKITTDVHRLLHACCVV